MAKKPRINDAQATLENHLSQEILGQLDFTETQKQVETLMKSVLHENTLNENKIRFIKEQLNDYRYQINAKTIATKILEFSTYSELDAEELSTEA